MSVVTGQFNFEAGVVQAMNKQDIEPRGFSQDEPTRIDSGSRNSNGGEMRMFGECTALDLDDLLSEESLFSISVDDMNSDVPKFILATNLKDTAGKDLFEIDSATGELKMTKAGIKSFINDAEALPDLHSVNVLVKDRHGAEGIKEMVLLERNLPLCGLEGGRSIGSIDVLLCSDNGISDNDFFEFL